MLAIKAGAGVGVVVLASMIMLVASRCDGCDSQTISASQNLATTSTTAPPTTADAAGPKVSLEISTQSTLLALSEELLALTEGQSTTTTAEADASETTVEGDESTTPTSTTAATSAPATPAVAAEPSSTAVPTTAAPTTTAKPTTTKAPTTAAPTAPPAPPTENVPASGQTFHINPSSGNDDNDGKSASSAWKSLQTGLRRVQPGQTLLLHGGDYTELKVPNQAHYSVDRGGSAGNWVKIKAAPGARPTIIASNGTGLLVQASYVEVSGLTIRGSGFNTTNNWGAGISVSGVHHVRVVGNSISKMAASGISVTKSSNVHVIGNDVFENAFWSPVQGSGISFWEPKNMGQGADSAGYHDRVEGNRVYKNENKVNSQFKDFKHKTDGNGIILDSGTDSGYSGKTLVANNLVYGNGGRGILAWKHNDVDIFHNTTYQNGQTDGILGGATEIAAGRGRNFTIANNVSWARSGLPALILDGVSNSNTYNNVLITDKPSGHASGSDIMHSGNPGFRNATTNSGNADFRPSAGSMLQGKAQSTPWFIKTDMVGTSRGNGTPDIGAFEVEASRR